MNKIVLMIAAAAAGTCLVSCTNSTTNHPFDSEIGKQCEVQFKRNALGGAADLPVPPTTSTINGAEVSIRGSLQAVTDDGILIQFREAPTWIPMDSILLVKVLE